MLPPLAHCMCGPLLRHIYTVKCRGPAHDNRWQHRFRVPSNVTCVPFSQRAVQGLPDTAASRQEFD